MSIKVVDGQLDFWKLLLEFPKMGHGMADALFRDFVKAVEVSQRLAPDVLPRVIESKSLNEAKFQIESNPLIESDTGRVFTAIS